MRGSRACTFDALTARLILFLETISAITVQVGTFTSISPQFGRFIYNINHHLIPEIRLFPKSLLSAVGKLDMVFSKVAGKPVTEIHGRNPFVKALEKLLNGTPFFKETDRFLLKVAVDIKTTLESKCIHPIDSKQQKLRIFRANAFLINDMVARVESSITSEAPDVVTAWSELKKVEQKLNFVGPEEDIVA